jgi:multicomponent Na+:H+ antiporter subunit E
MIARLLLLAFAWVALTGDASPGNALFALGLAALALVVARPLDPGGRARVRWTRLPGFVLYFAWQVLIANARVARAVLAPLPRLRPGIVAVPLTLERDAEIALLANLITLTPGTLSIEVSEDRRTLYVHALGVSDAEAVRAEVRAGFERRIKEVLR